MSEFDSAAVTGGHSEGSLVRSTGDLERGAAAAIGPILERTLAELDLSPLKAQMLMRPIAEAYMRGRAEGINVFPHQADRALSAEGIAIALAIHHGPLAPAPGRAGDRAGEREALEATARAIAHTVTVEAAVDWDDPEHLAHLLAALDACPESVGPPVGALHAPARDRRDPHGPGRDREGRPGGRHPHAHRRDGEARPGLSRGAETAADRTRQPIRSASSTMIPSGPRT